MDDMSLLKAYAEEGSESAFATLVSRHLSLVYCTALRRVRDPQLAEDIAQAVFIILARKARSLRRETILSGWLYRTTRYAVADALKSEARRRRREQETPMETFTTEPDSGESAWQAIAPVLDDALAALGATDRNAIILRFFENQTFKQIGQALGMNEDTARIRLSRAIEKLRSLLAKRKIVVPTMTLATLLAANSVSATIPGTLASSITAASAVKGAAASGSVLTILQGTLKLMAWTKIKTVTALGAAALLVAGTALQQRSAYRFRHQLVSVHAHNAPLAEVIHQLERQTGQTIRCDKSLDRNITLDVSSQPLPKVLDEVIGQAGAYWGTDFAIYESKAGLNRLLDALQSGARLQEAGWTNLSTAKIDYAYTVKYHYPDGTYQYDHGASAGVPREGYKFVRLSFDVNMTSTRIASQEEQMERMTKLQQLGGGILGTSKSNALVTAAEGALAPERLLAELPLAAKVDATSPVTATPEEAARIAAATHGFWTTVYTLRRSPVEGAGIRLVHLGEPMLPRPTNFSETLQQGRIQMLSLSPEQREDHARAMAKLHEKH